MALDVSGTAKCHPSSLAGTMPSQPPVGLKSAALTGVVVLGSSGT